jgi:predicted nucleic acid-binding protein
VTYLLDTNIIVDVLNDRRGRAELVLRLAGQGGLLACTGINVAEVYAGMRTHEEAKTDRLLKSLTLLETSWIAAKRAGEMAREWRGKGRMLHLPDLLIASTAIEYGAVLVTANVRDFPMEEVQIYPIK